MKKIITFFLILASLNASAQDSTLQIAYDAKPITIDIPDYTVNGTVVKRKASLFTMTYNQHAKTLSLTWTVKCYSELDGKYGEYIGKMIPDYSRESVADNATAVNPATGQILVADSTGKYTINWMGQYDWFHMVSEAQPLHVANMIRQYGAMMKSWDK